MVCQLASSRIQWRHGPLTDIFQRRACVMQSVLHRGAMRVAFQEVMRGRELNCGSRVSRGWKLFLLPMDLAYTCVKHLRRLYVFIRVSPNAFTKSATELASLARFFLRG